MKIVIAHDEGAILTLISKILGSHNLLVCENCAQALGVLTSPNYPYTNKVDLIILNTRLYPGHADIVIRIYKTAGAKVLVISGDPENKQWAMDQKADAFLATPFGVDKLLEVVGELLPSHSASSTATT